MPLAIARPSFRPKKETRGSREPATFAGPIDAAVRTQVAKNDEAHW